MLRLLRFRWLFNRRVGRMLLWCSLIVLVAVMVNLIGIRVVGSIAHWEQWLHQHAGYFLFWRICLYAATGYGWVWMRRRLLQREPFYEVRQRLLRSEIAAVLTILLLETSVLMQA
ncbi:hypothetical protein JBO49_16075 [Serratia fonticola]|nr:hypothetical protein [Serratia fonticola]MBL5862135.1 hypothetical protein [Serratia fonticola]